VAIVQENIMLRIQDALWTTANEASYFHLTLLPWSTTVSSCVAKQNNITQQHCSV